MSVTPFRKQRQVVPRWRPLTKTIAIGELGRPVNSTTRDSKISLELRNRLEEWRRQPNIITASELVETSLIEGHEDEAVRAARTLAAPNSSATSFLRQQASLLLQRAERGEEIAEKPHVYFSPIARARQRTREFLHDPYAWTDLALAYVIWGKNAASKRSMLTALQLAPNDRHVLRSAARLFLHLGDPERAHDLIKNNDATRNDPWLMAAEIAISGIAKRNPVSFKSGIRLVEDGSVRPRHISELASAIGTVHLWDGNRRARKLFTTSLVDPTGNSLAQAEWASPHIGNLVRPQALARGNESAEARVFQAYWNSDFREVINECAAWQEDEAFSSRPHQFGSGAALTLEEFEVALQFTEDGLKANPNAVILHNNRAFALISLGRYDEASSVLSHCVNKFPEESVGPVIATAGLWAMRIGQFEEGKKRYREAISLFKRSNNSLSEALARVYFALEAARADLPEAEKIFQEAKDICKNIQFLPEANIVLGRAETWLKATAHRRQLSHV